MNKELHDKLKIYAKHNIRENHIMINKIVMVTADEKSNNAEFPTPLWLVDEMLAKIPEEFWSSDATVFDPCVGKCPFPTVVFEKLMVGLTEKYTDPQERRKHILEDLIYFADINPLNVYISKFILDPFNQYKLNYHCGDTLKLNITDKWGLSGFGAVVGNPPYNASGGTATGNTIWNLFVKKTINEWLSDLGYICHVHPSGWRKPCYKKSQLKGLFKLMTHDNQMLYLEIHGIKDGLKTFNAGTRYDWYVIQKLKPSNVSLTIIKDELGVEQQLNLYTFEWLPNSNITDIINLLKPDKDIPCQIILNSSYHATHRYMSHKETNEFKYPCIHSTNKSGVRYMYSSRNDKGAFGVSKVIFGESGINDVIIDLDGKYGMTQHAMGILVDNLQEAECLKKALLSYKFKQMLESCMFSNFRIDWRLFTYFKKDFWREFV